MPSVVVALTLTRSTEIFKISAMRARIGEILSLDMSRISVKATTTEGMGYTGRREGLAAQAVATVRLS